jgi:hypothetical protein
MNDASIDIKINEIENDIVEMLLAACTDPRDAIVETALVTFIKIARDGEFYGYMRRQKTDLLRGYFMALTTIILISNGQDVTGTIGREAMIDEITSLLCNVDFTKMECY